MNRTRAGLILGAACVGIVAVGHLSREGPSRRSELVSVVARKDAHPAPRIVAPIAASRAHAVPVRERDTLLAALRLPDDTAITDIVRDDPRRGVVCGSLLRSGARDASRFVVFAHARMGALDDGGPDSAATWGRACVR